MDAAASTRPPLTSLKLETTSEKVTEAPILRVTHPVDLSAKGGLLPVVVWANGGCLRSDVAWIPLFDRWASAGFVVLSLSVAGDDTELTSALTSTEKADHAALLDWAVQANASGPYAEKLDLSRIVIAGNSCGGVTSLEVASEDKRPAAVFVLSGSSAVGSVDTAIMERLQVPVAYVTGSLAEDVAAPNARDDYAAVKDDLPAMWISRKAGDHFTISSDPELQPQNAEIALNWMDLVLYGTRQAFETLTSPNVCDLCTPGDWTVMSKRIETLVK